MYVVHERCCGLDIHKKIILACILICTAQGLQRKTEAFGTTVPELLRLLAWLKAHECSHVAMESTGVFWKPIYNLLEGEVEILLVNAQQTKALPGRKTDVKDAEWIADLLQHGLLRGSFVPPRPQRELRELTRYRSSLIADRARLVNRMHKVLEDSNIKLTSLVSQVVPSSLPYCKANRIPRCWRNWLVGDYAPNETNWLKPCKERCASIIRCC